MLEGNATPAQIAAFIFGLRCKGETVEEMTGLVAAMLAASERVVVPDELAGRVVDTCGTGGDRRGTINVSTIAALVVAGAGVPVCKHGGRAASSKAGSADVLEALGVVIDLGPAGVTRCIEEAGIGFCFAPLPPGDAPCRPDPARAGRADRLQLPRSPGQPGPGSAAGGRCRRPGHGREDGTGAGRRGGHARPGRPRGRRARRAVHHRPLDALRVAAEIAVVGRVWFARASACRLGRTGRLRRPAGIEWRPVTVDPAVLGLRPARLAELLGGDAAPTPASPAGCWRGEPGPHRDVVLLNAAAGLVAAGVCADLEAGLDRAAAADRSRGERRGCAFAVW